MPLNRLRISAAICWSFLPFWLTLGSAKDYDQNSSRSSVQNVGAYLRENEIKFNVLDGASFDPVGGNITLFGHFSSRYPGPRVPYLQHLAVLLDQPRPEFSLEWTAETHQRVNTLFRQTRSADWMQTFDGHDHVTQLGAYLFQSLGIYSTRNHQAPGYIGLKMQPGPPGSNTLQVVSVDSGSPAASVGMKPGQIITTIPGAPLLELPVVEHIIRFSGAGSVFPICVQGKNDCYKPVLTAVSGDSWSHMSRHDISAEIFRVAGRAKAAQAMDAISVSFRASGLETAIRGMYEVLDAHAEHETIEAAVVAGKLDRDAASQQMLRSLCERMEVAFDARGQLVAAFDKAGSSGGSLSSAFNAVLSLLAQVAGLQEQQALGHLSRPGGVQIPQELVPAAAGFHFEVVPKFIRLRSDSLLAKVMEDSDYIAKTIINKQELATKFPSYQTEQDFNAVHPETARPEGESHVWISPHYIDASQSSDHSTLLIRGIKMRFNMRDTGANGKDLPRLRGGYESLLTSLYDDLSTEYPVLHELSEASKLSLVAEWIHSQNPDLQLPKEGQVSWPGPHQLPGFVYFYVQSYIIGASAKMRGFTLPTGGVALSPFPRGNTNFLLSDIVGTDPQISSSRDGSGGKPPNPFLAGGNNFQSIAISSGTTTSSQRQQTIDSTMKLGDPHSSAAKDLNDGKAIRSAMQQHRKPPFQQLWDHYRYNRPVAAGLEPESDRCAMVLSMSLGLEPGAGEHSFLQSTDRLRPGIEGRYYLRAQELSGRLLREWGPPEYLQGRDPEKLIQGRKGVIYLEHAYLEAQKVKGHAVPWPKMGDHIDLWDRDHLATPATKPFNWAREVWFWELP